MHEGPGEGELPAVFALVGRLPGLALLRVQDALDGVLPSHIERRDPEAQLAWETTGGVTCSLVVLDQALNDRNDGLNCLPAMTGANPLAPFP